MPDGKPKIDDPAKKAESFADQYDVREVGKIHSIREFLITVTGLRSCINGQIVEFEGGRLMIP